MTILTILSLLTIAIYTVVMVRRLTTIHINLNLDYQKLINEYNSVNLNIDTTNSEKIITQYKNFLIHRAELKKRIYSDFEEYINSKKQEDIIFD